MDDPVVLGVVFSFGFAVFFAGIWFLITKLLVRMSGWSGLEQHFPDRPFEQANEKWSAASAAFGRSAIGGVNFRNSLVMEACQSGLRIRIWRLLAPFSGPIFVPWSQIKTESGALWTVLVALGEPEKGCLRIHEKFARKIAAASRAQFTVPADKTA